jgi:phenylacetate-CoA ligase
MRRIGRIGARTDDMLIIRGVNLFPSQVEELILGMPGLAPHYQLELTRAGPLDALTVHVERAPECDAARGAELGADLARHIKGRIGVSAAIQVCDPGGIERSIGKAKRVVDRR